jgi:hypothetical protein
MKTLIGVVAIALLGCTTNQSQLVRGTPASSAVLRGEIYYDCDAASGHTSQWSRTIEQTGSVTGTLFIRELRTDDNWAPFGGVLISGPLPDNPVGMQVTADPTATMLLAELRPPKRRWKAPPVELGSAPTSGIQFALQWDASKLQVRVDPAEPWTEVALPFKPERLWLVCATSNVVFHSVSVTSAPPASVTSPPPAPSVEPTP